MDEPIANEPNGPVEVPRDRAADLRRLFSVVRRRAPLVLLCVIATAAVAVGISLLQQKEYSASASILFRNSQFAQDLFGSGGSSAVNASPLREAATNEKLV